MLVGGLLNASFWRIEKMKTKLKIFKRLEFYKEQRLKIDNTTNYSVFLDIVIGELEWVLK